MASRILVVDDNATNLKLVRVLLEVDGHDVRTAVNAEEALATIGAFSPHLVLMDVQLPGMNGLALTRLLLEDPAHRALIIVALSAYAMPEDVARAQAAGCKGYITKPIDTRTFRAIIAAHLATSGQA